VDVDDQRELRGEMTDMPQLYGTWLGGLPCVLTVDRTGRPHASSFALDGWTLEGERQTFVIYRAEPPACRN
jgi:hypothetical protein